MAPKRDVGNSKSSPSIPAAELLSFLKETRRVQPWTEKDLAKALRIGSADANQAVAALQLQGYIEPAGSTGKWRTTEQGEIVSGAKSARFTRESVEAAVTALRERIKAVNNDKNAAYTIIEAVVFGDFLSDAARVQAADIGIRLSRKANGQAAGPTKEHAAELAFLKELRGKTALLHLQTFEEWMRARTHRDLL